MIAYSLVLGMGTPVLVGLVVGLLLFLLLLILLITYIQKRNRQAEAQVCRETLTNFPCGRLIA